MVIYRSGRRGIPHCYLRPSKGKSIHANFALSLANNH
jgi:hypothetical protein